MTNINRVGFFPEIEGLAPRKKLALKSLVALCPEGIRKQVCGYLKAGHTVLAAGGFEADCISGASRKVPQSYKTDGVWVWQGGLAYYVETYGVGLPEEFVEHMKASAWVVSPVPDKIRFALAREIRGG